MGEYKDYGGGMTWFPDVYMFKGQQDIKHFNNGCRSKGGTPYASRGGIWCKVSESAIKNDDVTKELESEIIKNKIDINTTPVILPEIIKRTPESYGGTPVEGSGDWIKTTAGGAVTYTRPEGYVPETFTGVTKLTTKDGDYVLFGMVAIAALIGWFLLMGRK